MAPHSKFKFDPTKHFPVRALKELMSQRPRDIKLSLLCHNTPPFVTIIDTIVRDALKRVFVTSGN